MQRRTSLAIASLLWLAASARAAEDDSAWRSLTAKTGWIRFEVIRGRLTALVVRHQKEKACTSAGGDQQPQERLSICTDHGQTRVQYQLIDDDRTLSAEFLNGDQVVICCGPRDGLDSKKLEFRQHADGSVECTFSGGVGPAVNARSLWHLALAEPEFFVTHIEPMLNVLRPNWRLHEMATQFKQRLMREAADASELDMERWRELVDQLKSSRFTERRAAERQLLEIGPALEPFLADLDRSRLDAEQRCRLRTIESALATTVPDSPARLVDRSLADTSLWFVVLNSGSFAERQLAAVRLRGLTGRTIEVEEHSDSEDRHERIAKLKKSLGYK